MTDSPTNSQANPQNPQTTIKLALLFPGQGSQVVGMGKAFYDTAPAARAIFQEADDALGFALSRLIFEGPEDQLKLTEHTQPAILTTSVAILRALEPELKSRNLTVACAPARHPLPPRRKFWQAAGPAGVGAMAAILGLSAARINDICARVSDEL